MLDLTELLLRQTYDDELQRYESTHVGIDINK